MKKCTRCKLKKSIDKFYPDKHNTTGFSSICKICNRKKVLEYKRTKRGLIFTIYSTQKATSKNKITGEVINHYSVSKASKHTGVNRATISRLINNKELNNHNKYKFEKYES